MSGVGDQRAVLFQHDHDVGGAGELGHQLDDDFEGLVHVIPSRQRPAGLAQRLVGGTGPQTPLAARRIQSTSFGSSTGASVVEGMAGFLKTTRRRCADRETGKRRPNAAPSPIGQPRWRPNRSIGHGTQAVKAGFARLMARCSQTAASPVSHSLEDGLSRQVRATTNLQSRTARLALPCDHPRPCRGCAREDLRMVHLG